MNRSQRFWDGQAANFDEGDSEFEHIHRKTLENTKKHLHESDIVLDYGCATGIKAFAIADHVKMIYGIDISSKMIEQAKRKADEHKIENVEFAQASLFDERYESESFDVILAFNILHLLEDYQQAVQRIAELLKPGGLFISTTPCLKEKMALLTYCRLSFALLLSKIGLLPIHLKKMHIAELEALIVGGKLQIVETERLFQKLTSYYVVAKKI